MTNLINVSFNVYSDTPSGKDPDTYSPTLKKYHKLLWSKELPNGYMFNLSDSTPKILYNKSNAGEFFLSSDSIGHSYRSVKSMSHIINQIPPFEIDEFFALCSTIGGYIIFPSKKIDNKMTINGSRGMNRSIKDRFDLTLECIRLHYMNERSPLSETLQRYSEFFNLFSNFQGYVDFFLLQDLVNENYKSVNFCLPFNSFNQTPLPNNIDQYRLYKKNMIAFLNSRNKRILNATLAL